MVFQVTFYCTANSGSLMSTASKKYVTQKLDAILNIEVLEIADGCKQSFKVFETQVDRSWQFIEGNKKDTQSWTIMDESWISIESWIIVAVYLRSLPKWAAEEKNIPGPSRELIDCK